MILEQWQAVYGINVKLNRYPLWRNDRDRRGRSEARRMEHSLVWERSVVRILPSVLNHDYVMVLLTFICRVETLTPPFAARMILLRTEHDRPAVFLEHLSHYARSETQTVLFLDIRPL